MYHVDLPAELLGGLRHLAVGHARGQHKRDGVDISDVGGTVLFTLWGMASRY